MNKVFKHRLISTNVTWKIITNDTKPYDKSSRQSHKQAAFLRVVVTFSMKLGPQ